MKRHEKAARFDSGQQVGLVRRDDFRHPVDRGMPGLVLRQHRRDVAKHDARLGKVRHVANPFLQVHVVQPPRYSGIGAHPIDGGRAMQLTPVALARKRRGAGCHDGKAALRSRR
jgi:hypothetical protein